MSHWRDLPRTVSTSSSTVASSAEEESDVSDTSDSEYDSECDTDVHSADNVEVKREHSATDQPTAYQSFQVAHP